MQFDNVAIVDITETQKSRGKIERGDEYHSLEKYHEIVSKNLLESAGIEKSDVDGWAMGLPYAPTDESYPIRLLETLGLNVHWLTTTRDGGVSASSLLAQAAMAVESGVTETVICSLADLPMDPYHKNRDDDGPTWDPDPRGYMKQYLLPYGCQGPNERAAHAVRRHMAEYGTTLEQLGKIPVTQRYHATLNPLAAFDEEMTLEEWRDSPMISDPHRMYDCVMRVNAGLGYLLTTKERAKELTDDPVYVEGAGFNYADDVSPKPDVTISGMKEAGNIAYEQAGCGPEDIDFLQLYDDYPIMVIEQLEDLGFCEKGEGGSFVESTDLRYDGELPLNTGGGQLSAGQPGVGAGAIQVNEAVRQLKGTAKNRQIDNPNRGIITGLANLGYGTNTTGHGCIILTNEEESHA